MREEEILSQLMDIIDELDIDQLGIKDRIYKELFRYQTLAKSVLGHPGNNMVQMPKVDVKAYAKYILKDGGRDEKRELLACLKTRLYIKDRKVYAGSAS